MSTRASDPRVALLVACHDDGATIAETIETIRAEPGVELVIVDDGSTDPMTVDRLDELERDGVRVIRAEHAGPSAAWRRGLGETVAHYVMPFSSDDLLVPGSVQRLADALDANPAAAAAWGDFEAFGAAKAYVPMAPALCPWYITYANTLPGIALFRRDRLVEVGGWRLTTGMEDWDLWMRLAAAGAVGVYVPEAIFLYRRDAGGRFRGRVRRFEPFYEELRGRNRRLFAERSRNRATSPVPRILKVLFPMVDRLPISRLVKVQLCDLLSLLFWRAGWRRTARILVQGVFFRVRLAAPGP